MDDHLAKEVGYWARRTEITKNEFVADAVFEKIARLRGDHLADAPSETVMVFNQLVDRLVALEYGVENLAKIVTAVSRSFMAMTRGDNYLLDVDGIDGDDTD